MSDQRHRVPRHAAQRAMTTGVGAGELGAEQEHRRRVIDPDDDRQPRTGRTQFRFSHTAA